MFVLALFPSLVPSLLPNSKALTGSDAGRVESWTTAKLEKMHWHWQLRAGRVRTGMWGGGLFLFVVVELANTFSAKCQQLRRPTSLIYLPSQLTIKNKRNDGVPLSSNWFQCRVWSQVQLSPSVHREDLEQSSWKTRTYEPVLTKQGED